MSSVGGGRYALLSGLLSGSCSHELLSYRLKTLLLSLFFLSVSSLYELIFILQSVAQLPIITSEVISMHDKGGSRPFNVAMCSHLLGLILIYS